MTVKQGSTIKVKISSGIETFVLSDYSGSDENEVYAIFTDNSIEFTTITEYNDTISEGCVIRTEPAAGTEVDRGTVVIVYVSNGSEMTYTTMPNVLGYKLSDAKLLLNSAGIKIGNVTAIDSTQESTVVLNQSIAQGTEVPVGSSVDLTIVVDRDSNSNEVEIMVALPNKSGNIKMTASLNGTTVSEETVSLDSNRYWKASFSGEGIATASIYYDGQLYMAYSVNFADGTSMVVTDNSANFS